MALRGDTFAVGCSDVHSILAISSTIVRDGFYLAIGLDLPLQLGSIDTRSRGDKKGSDTFQSERMALNNSSRIATSMHHLVNAVEHYHMLGAIQWNVKGVARELLHYREERHHFLVCGFFGAAIVYPKQSE